MKKPWRKTRQAQWRKRNPWARYVEWCRRRCNDGPGGDWYPFYGAKGITCDLTSQQLKAVWERDEAWKLKKPSLDRKDPNGNYTMFNVRFVEFKLNARMAWDEEAKAEFV